MISSDTQINNNLWPVVHDGIYTTELLEKLKHTSDNAGGSISCKKLLVLFKFGLIRILSEFLNFILELD